VVWRGAALTLETLLLVYAAANLLKAGLLWRRFRAEARPARWVGPSLRWLRAAFPFFLLGFSGLLQSRVDLYFVSAYLPPGEIGRYQVFINFMIYLQSGAGLILVPFLKALYRLTYSRLVSLSLRMLALGGLVAGIALPLLAVGLRQVYGLRYAPGFFLAGLFIVLPLYFYAPIIYALFKADRPLTVVAANLVGVGVNVGLMSWWLPAHGALGAAWSAAAAQCALGLLYAWLGLRLQIDNGASTPATP
jgi:O-antigen/teichoic acid export membrane protein